jgi:hypothetical protein
MNKIPANVTKFEFKESQYIFKNIIYKTKKQ